MFGITTTTTSGQERAPPPHDEASREGVPGRDFGYGGADAGWQRVRRPALLQPLQPLQPLTGMGHQLGAAVRSACSSWEGHADAGGRRRPHLGAPADLLRGRHAAEPTPQLGTGMPLLQPPPPPPLGQRSAGAFWGLPHQMQNYHPVLPPPPPRRLLQTLSAPTARTPFMLLQAARRDTSTAASRLASFHGASSPPASPPFHPQYGAHPPAAGFGGEDRHVIRAQPR